MQVIMANDLRSCHQLFESCNSDSTKMLELSSGNDYDTYITSNLVDDPRNHFSIIGCCLVVMKKFQMSFPAIWHTAETYLYFVLSVL